MARQDWSTAAARRAGKLQAVYVDLETDEPQFAPASDDNQQVLRPTFCRPPSAT